MIIDPWQMLDSSTFAVTIDAKTTLGEFALMHFSRRVPQTIRRNWASFRWDGDFEKDGARWGRIRVTWL